MNNTNKHLYYRLLHVFLLLAPIAVPKALGQCNLSVSPSMITFNGVGQLRQVSVSGGCNYVVSADSYFGILKTVDGSELTIAYNTEVPPGAPTTYYIRLRDPNNSSRVLATITVDISPMRLTGGIIEAPVATVVSGDSPGTFTNARYPTGGNGNFSYQWQRASGKTPWTNIMGATGLTYACPPLTATASFRRMVTSGSGIAYSNTIQITVEAAQPPPPPPPPPIVPSADRNYILTRTMLDSEGASSFNKVDYFDGLGRPVQSVLHKATPALTDIVTLQEYDGVGRPSNSYIPVPVNTNTGEHVSPSTVKTSSANFYGDAHAHGKNVYEPSPLNRVTESYGPGSAWHGGGRSIKTGFMTNAPAGELSCALYAVAPGTFLERRGLYAPGELYVTKTTNEDGHIAYTFTDKLGQVVLERVMDGPVTNDTHYVHDDLGELCYVLPPLAADALTANTTWADTHPALADYAYIYKYDDRKRRVQKKLPGCEPVEMRYDRADRMVFSRDGKQRSDGEWTFHLHDVFGRPTVTGVWVSPTVPDVGNTVVTSSRDAAGAKLGGYAVNLTLPAAVRLMTVNYYDDHSFTSGMPQLDYVTPPAGYDARFDSARGLLTGSRSYRLDDPSKYSVSAIYYDHRGRVVQSHTSNHLGGFDDEYFAHTFTGKVRQHRRVHSAPGKTTQTETYVYDHGSPATNPTERLLSVSHKLNSTPAVTLAEYTYDEAGRILTKKLATETSTYSYNVRSWLTQITGTKFNQTLAYNAAVNGVTPSKALYGGNIGAMKWKAGDEAAERGYKFAYDGLDRLSAATYGEGMNMTDNLNRYNETVTAYDKMGNILSLQRRGKISDDGYGLMDNLTYTYTGNQLTRVTDAVTTPITYEGAFHFVDRANVDNEYTYNANGNLTGDLNKNITSITYNVLNLPNVVTFANGNTITYVYDAAGSKLSVAYNSGTTTSRMDYAGNKVYKNGTLSMILTGEGYATLSVTTPTYYYYLKDHQGNNRVVINQSGAVQQVNHYYPFGGLFGEGVQTANHRYKYNGKELDRLYGLDMYDYGARHYDAATGRWGTPDLLMEKYYSTSPYVYVVNNPVRFIDPDGRFVATIVGTIVGGAKGAYDAHKKGMDMWAGAAEGAVSGAITGAVIDGAVALTVATGGGALVVIGAGVAAGAAGGAAGGIAGDVAGQVVTQRSEETMTISTENFAGKAVDGAISGVVSGLTGGAVGAIGKAAGASTQAVQQTMSKNISSTATTLTSQGASQGTVNTATSGITKGMGTAGSNTANSMIKIEAATSMATETATIMIDDKLKKNK